MRVLLDTHYLLWWLGSTNSLGPQAQKIIADPSNLVFVSVVSLWELRIKEAIGKVELPENFRQVVEQQSFESLSLTADHTDALGGLPFHHRDPFDRMLIAQSRTEGLTLLTRDKIIALYDVDHLLL